MMSGPARDLWIEITWTPTRSRSCRCRVPQGTCGLKYAVSFLISLHTRRVPQGTCGLKSPPCLSDAAHGSSGPARDLWIEIDSTLKNWMYGKSRVPQGTCGLKLDGVDYAAEINSSGPARDLWIEITRLRQCSHCSASGPARDLWIEILMRTASQCNQWVGSRKGPVD